MIKKAAWLLCASLYAGVLTGFGTDQNPGTHDVHVNAATNVTVITGGLIKELLAEATNHNPFLRASRERVKAARYNLENCSCCEEPALSCADLIFSARSSGSKKMCMMMGMPDMSMGSTPMSMGSTPMNSTNQSGPMTEEFEQKLKMFNHSVLAGQYAQAALTKEELELDCRTQMLRRELVALLIKIALMETELDLGDKGVAWLRMILEAKTQYYHIGTLSQAQLMDLQISLAKRVEQLRTAKNTLTVEYLALNRILNRTPEAVWTRLRLPEIAPSITQTNRLIELAMKNEPRLRLINMRVKQSEVLDQITRARELLNVSTQTNGFQSPSLQLQLDGFERLIRESILRLLVQIDTARGEAVLYRDEIIPRQRQSLESTETACQSNLAGFCDVLEVHRALLESEMAYARAVAEQYQMLADLSLATRLELDELWALAAKN